MSRLTVPASLEQLENVLSFVNERLNEADCPEHVKMQTDVAVEEIFINIARYAYSSSEECGFATIECRLENDPPCVTIQFMDQGRPYNPLEREDPDITLSAEEREIGGLGIFIVKKTMDCVMYQYKEGKNILTIAKGI